MEMLRREKVLNTANLLTILRIVLMPAVVWRFRSGDSAGALAVYALSMFTDVADGFVARHFGQITNLGRLLDPVADKLSLLVVMGMFAVDGQIPMWVLYLVLIKEIALIIGSGAALQCGIVVSALPIGKAATVFFALSVFARLLARRVAADMLLAISLMLSMAALLWYFVVMGSRIKGNDTVSTK